MIYEYCKICSIIRINFYEKKHVKITETYYNLINYICNFFLIIKGNEIFFCKLLHFVSDYAQNNF